MGRDVAAYCLVTVVHGRRRIDVALPAAVPVAELLAGLLRVVAPETGPHDAGVWELVPIARPVIGPSETLDDAGVLTGDLVVLRQQDNAQRAGPPGGASVRDQLEEIVQRNDETWTAGRWVAFLLWSAAVLGVVLLIPASRLSGVQGAATTAAVAAGLAACALLASRHAQNVSAATCLWIGCGWAGLAGWFLSPGGLAAAAAAALLPAFTAVAGYRSALTHCAAMAVVLPATGAILLATGVGYPTGQALVVAAVLALLLLGFVPRIVLAVVGLAPTLHSADTAPVEVRFVRADLVLTGALIGLTAMVVAGGTVLAFSPDPLDHALSAGIGVSLLLRSRVYSRIPHLLPTRIGGALLLVAIGAGVYLRQPGLRLSLILLPVVGLAVTVAVLTLVGGSMTDVRRARIARCLDLLDQLLVIAVIVCGSGTLGLFGWMATVAG